jgi:hypothetical protein
MATDTHHPCPICAAPVRHWPRYPRAVCERCEARATDRQGRGLRFLNADFVGGFRGNYSDTMEAYGSHTCFIDGVECRADEARFGGIVIQTVSPSER